MPNTNTNRRVVLKSTGPVYDVDAKAYFDRLDPQPSAKYKAAVNAFIISSKANGNWRWDRFWILRAENRQNARVSVANPTSIDLLEINSPTWAAGQGYTFDGATNYLNTSYIPSTNGVEYTLNSGCLFMRLETDTASGTQIDFGGGLTSGTANSSAWIGVKSFTNQAFCRINETSSLVSGAGTVGSSIGDWAAIRTNSTSESVLLNGSSLISSTSRNSVALPIVSVYIGCVNNNGTPANFSDRRFSFAGIGSGVINAAALSADLTTLRNALDA